MPEFKLITISIPLDVYERVEALCPSKRKGRNRVPEFHTKIYLQGRVTMQTNGRGAVTTFAYNTPLSGTTSITDSLGSVTQHVYDSNLRLVMVIDARGGTTSYTYDANNDRVSVTNANGQAILFTYDAHGNVTSVTNPVGGVARFSYDAFDEVLATTDPLGHVSLLSYDAAGNLTGIRDPEGRTVSFAYDSHGQLLSFVRPLSATTRFAYDAFGNVTNIADPLGHTTSLSYDVVGRLVRIIDHTGSAVAFTFDVLNRLAETVNTLGYRNVFTYDSVGNLATTSDASGHVTAYQHDASNNLVAIIDALGGVTTHTYDKNSNRTASTDANGNTTTFSFDSLNRLVSSTNPLGAMRLYSYDPAGNVVSFSDENGKTHVFGYDALNRRIAASYADGTTFTFAYDNNGNRTVMTDSTGKSEYTYDALNRLASVLLPSGRRVSYEYDAAGRRRSVTYPDGKVVHYAYDMANHLTSVVDWNGATTSYGYDGRGKLVTVKGASETSSAYKYDAAGRLVEVRNAYRHGTFTFLYTLDGVGNKLQLHTGGQDHDHLTYEYDALNRLTLWRDGEGSATRYTYDAVGNRLTARSRHGVLSYAYNRANQLTDAGPVSYRYDQSGNLISKGGIWPTTYRYDSLNRLTSIVGHRVSISNIYNGDGNRVSQRSNREAVEFVRDVGGLFPSVLSKSGRDGTASFVYGNSIISGETPRAERFGYQLDGIGSVVDLTSQAGSVARRIEYDPWGKILGQDVGESVDGDNPFRFAAGEFDSDSGLYYFLARYYDPELGRFLSSDRFPGFSAAPQTHNGYVYAGNNPLTLTDRGGTAFGADDGIALFTGAIGGLVGQYFSDVAANIDSGATGLDILASTSSWQDYLVSTAGGAVTADLGLNGFEFGGPVGAGLGAAAGTAGTDLVKSWVDGKSVDWGGVAIDSGVSGFTGGLLETFPHVPGALPNWFSDSFFFGSHAEDSWIKTAVGVGVGLVNSLVTGAIPNASDQNMNLFQSPAYQAPNPLLSK